MYVSVRFFIYFRMCPFYLLLTPIWVKMGFSDKLYAFFTARPWLKLSVPALVTPFILLWLPILHKGYLGSGNKSVSEIRTYLLIPIIAIYTDSFHDFFLSCACSGYITLSNLLYQFIFLKWRVLLTCFRFMSIRKYSIYLSI